MLCYHAAGLTIYSELASMFPNRSGAEVVYLEQAYPRPKFLVPVSFAVTTVLLSSVAINFTKFAYLLTLLWPLGSALPTRLSSPNTS